MDLDFIKCTATMINKFIKTIPEEGFTEVVGDEIISNENNMKSGIGEINWVNIKSALVYGVLWGLLSVGVYALGVGDVFALDWRLATNAFIFAFLGFGVSFLKNALTNNEGKFLGKIQVTPPEE